MSTTDPQRRLQRRSWFLPALRAVLWTLSGLGAFAIAFAIAAASSGTPGWAASLAAIPLLLAIAVGITDANTDAPDRRAAYPAPYLLWMLGLWAACVGAGLVLGRIRRNSGAVAQGVEYDLGWSVIALGCVLVVIGAAALVGARLLRAARGRHAERVRSIRTTGRRVPAVVTEVTRNRGSNTSVYWNVTLRFQDDDGTERWHRTLQQTHRVEVGSTHWIRFDPADPGRRSTIHVEWAPPR